MYYPGCYNHISPSFLMWLFSPWDLITRKGWSSYWPGPQLHWPLDCSLLNWLWVKDTWTECLTLPGLVTLHKNTKYFQFLIKDCRVGSLNHTQLIYHFRWSWPRSRGPCTRSWPSFMKRSGDWGRRRPSSRTRSSTAAGPGGTSPTLPPDTLATATRSLKSSGIVTGSLIKNT